MPLKELVLSSLESQILAVKYAFDHSGNGRMNEKSFIRWLSDYGYEIRPIDGGAKTLLGRIERLEKLAGVE